MVPTQMSESTTCKERARLNNPKQTARLNPTTLGMNRWTGGLPEVVGMQALAIALIPPTVAETPLRSDKAVPGAG
jgi:hypothetical protein